ncbi:MAG: hypothetical protein M3O70_17300 [Actinomycetota bacterium]|nr:hypothetical protein [Actinomycetota bacterium]
MPVAFVPATDGVWRPGLPPASRWCGSSSGLAGHGQSRVTGTRQYLEEGERLPVVLFRPDAPDAENFGPQ